MRAKIGADEAEAAGCGRPPVKADNEGWPEFRRNPQGRGGFPRLFCRSSLKCPDICHSSLRAFGKIRSRRCRPGSVNRPQVERPARGVGNPRRPSRSLSSNNGADARMRRPDELRNRPGGAAGVLKICRLRLRTFGHEHHDQSQQQTNANDSADEGVQCTRRHNRGDLGQNL